MSKLRIAACVSAVLAAWMTGPRAWADPGYYVVSIYEAQGQATVDYRYWTVKLPGAPEVVWPEIGFGYGVTKRWYTELLASFKGSAAAATRRSSLQWQNDFLMTQGQYDIDVALHTLLVRYDDPRDGRAFEFGPALQTEWGRWRLNANLIFEHSWGLQKPKPVQFKYQWKAAYRWKPEFQLGLMGFGELGEWDHWALARFRSQRLGPVLQGALPFGGPEAFHYEVSYLDGKIYTRHGHMLTARLHYDF